MDKSDKIIFYDIETNYQWAPYATLQIVGYQIGLEGEPEILDLNDPIKCQEFREILASPEWIKVHFNGINFDEIVLNRYGYWTNPINRHDVYLIAKTCYPNLPAYGLKFLNCYFFCDWHEPERLLKGWRTLTGETPINLLHDYCKYDVVQTAKLFKMFWPMVQTPQHWKAYHDLELPFGEVLHQIMLDGGDYINVTQTKNKINELTRINLELTEEANKLTEGWVSNPNSTHQIARWLKYFEQVEINVTEHGNLTCRKEDLLTLLDLDDPRNDTSRIARLCFEIRSNTKQIGYLRAFRRAALYELRLLANRRIYRQQRCIKIPKSYSLSSARTRRFTSSSLFGINFQNQDKYSKQTELNPPGWITFSIDLTQIENVVHIYESHDSERRKAYEDDENYNEYVWIGNVVLGTNMTKDQMDSIRSHVNNKWSVYKQFKTTKLAMNFGMGASLFATKNGLSNYQAKQLFETIHKACPAIRSLQRRVESDLVQYGYVSDPFGHIYSGREAYKVVAYLIQGCGTGSIPKAMARGIYDVLSELPKGTAYLCGLTHDEITFRLRNSQDSQTIINSVQRCLHVCTKQFSPLFDDIPLRAKLYMSTTNLAELKEIKPNQIEQAINTVLIYAN
jgi:DNA polymerase I-like protein with 3'-5' exonuclease and polymerase domains